MLKIDGLKIDSSSSVAPYEQVRAGIARKVASGELAVGTKLPTVRALADDLGIAVNTVARAYRELEGAGVVETRGRAGTVVTALGDTARLQVQHEAQRFAEAARRFGRTESEAIAIATAAVLEVYSTPISRG